MKKIFASLLALILLAYPYFIEPIWIETTSYTLKSPIKSPLKICHLTDLHISNIGIREKKVIEIVNTQKPDIVVITGDSIGSSEGWDSLHEFLNKLKSPSRKIFLVEGNWENWDKNKPESDYYKNVGIRLLRDEEVKLVDTLTVKGYSDKYSNENYRSISSDKTNPQFCISLFHSPAFFDEVAGQCFLNLSGHTHGGQVKLPFLKPFWLPKGSGEYVSGWYEKNNSKLYVSRGVGTSILPIRFFARPEVVFFNLEPV